MQKQNLHELPQNATNQKIKQLCLLKLTRWEWYINVGSLKLPYYIHYIGRNYPIK